MMPHSDIDSVASAKGYLLGFMHQVLSDNFNPFRHILLELASVSKIYYELSLSKQREGKQFTTEEIEKAFARYIHGDFQRAYASGGDLGLLAEVLINVIYSVVSWSCPTHFLWTINPVACDANENRFYETITVNTRMEVWLPVLELSSIFSDPLSKQHLHVVARFTSEY
jgi:hypothetical protein